MKHIGLNINAIELISNYFKEIKQYVELNCKQSDLLVIGRRSIQQGSVWSMLLYTIFMLDLPMISHEIIHTNHTGEFMCRNHFMITFIDDAVAVIGGDKDYIWKKVDKYVKKWKNTTTQTG